MYIVYSMYILDTIYICFVFFCIRILCHKNSESFNSFSKITFLTSHFGIKLTYETYNLRNKLFSEYLITKKNLQRKDFI